MPYSNFIAKFVKVKYLLWSILLFITIIIGWATASFGILVPGVLVAILVLIVCIAFVFFQPKLGLITFIIYCFTVPFFSREIGGGIPYDTLIYAIISLTLLAAIFNTSNHYQWGNINNELFFLGLAWIFINILEIVNPAGSIMGWLSDVKYPFLWILLVPVCLVIFNKKKDLDYFLILTLILSLVAALNGVKQLHLGLFPGEQAFLISAASTHLLWGQLRVFSFYQDAGQFGASMAHFCVIALVLALGPYKPWKKGLCAIAALVLLYGMLISGTRGALFALFTGILVFLVLTKNFKVFTLGVFIAFAAFFFLKYTYIGHGNYEIRRMRSALNPEDASLQARIFNQAKLRDYLSSHPFGGGVGSIGYAANKYNANTYLASIPPDSYWVKVWAMYGIVGLVIWFGMMMYILGKCCGIVWNTHDRGLKYKLIALTAGAAGIFISSYGNEVINSMPSSIIVYISWAFVFLGPKLDSKQPQNIQSYV